MGRIDTVCSLQETQEAGSGAFLMYFKFRAVFRIDVAAVLPVRWRKGDSNLGKCIFPFGERSLRFDPVAGTEYAANDFRADDLDKFKCVQFFAFDVCPLGNQCHLLSF